MKIVNEFRQFILRGNVVDLAIAVVIGVVFGAVVAALVEDLVTPLIAAIIGEAHFSELTFTINESVFKYGHFVNALLTFFIVAAIVFFLIVRPVNALVSRSRREPPAEPTTRRCPECQSEIHIDARRCAFCTSEVGPV